MHLGCCRNVREAIGRSRKSLVHLELSVYLGGLQYIWELSVCSGAVSMPGSHLYIRWDIQKAISLVQVSNKVLLCHMSFKH